MAGHDTRLAYEVERAISHLPGVNIHDLRVEVQDGRARLIGVVEEYSQKQAALDAAMAVDGILGTLDSIAVETPRPARDRDLASELDEALSAEDEDPAGVGASAVRGQAQLRGYAASVEDLGRAITTAGEVSGTVGVIDSARIDNPYGADGLDLVNAVADALGRHETLRTRAIRPMLEETGKVLLVGSVQSDAEREEAVRVASGVPGIHTVREELRVVP